MFMITSTCRVRRSSLLLYLHRVVMTLV
uniref:Uncharacterized protein n=1 Tax=Anguilla anguilla TaxID=7936 RepID=A0A0E9QUP5_ANGAN